MKVPHSVLPAILALALAHAALAAEGQQAARIYHLGYLGIATASEGLPILDVFRQGLRELGYVEGQNLDLEIRYADGKPEQLSALAAELVRLKVDIIVTPTGVAALGAKKVTQTIPIVMLNSSDAVRQGLVASLARPGGNVTGLTNISPETNPKRLQILTEMLPRVARVGILWCGALNPQSKQEWAETQEAAKVLGLQLSSLEARGREDLSTTFASAAKQRVQAVVMFDCSRLIPSADQIVELSLKHGLPAMYPYRRFAEAGGLMSYGVSNLSNARRGVSYVDKILKGAKPADLPVEQPTRFDFVINLKTAKALGLTIPQSLLLRADEIIQ
jgi:putative tryptophan/tyrosine transport system substrate-binding protein